MGQTKFDVIVIGAGAAGLMAAWELVLTGRTVAILEARDRIGGRIHTIEDKDLERSVELGAEFIHGDLELTQLLLKGANIESSDVTGSIWQKHEGELKKQEDFIEDYSLLEKKFEELDHDISVADFIKKHLQGDQFEEARFTLKNYVEGYYAGDTSKASTFALREELNAPEEDQYRIDGGYGKLVNYLLDQCNKKNVQLFLSHEVEAINWKKDQVVVTAGNNTFTSAKVLVTVPVSILQSGKISFSPALPKYIDAANQLGFGPVVKTIFQFDEAFWKEKQWTENKNLDKLKFIFSSAVIPTWWTLHPKKIAVLTGWAAGPHATSLKDCSDEDIVDKGIQSLSEIFTIEKTELRKKLKAWHVANWPNDPHTCGGYSYEVVNGHVWQKVLKTPVENTVFFAGEGLVEGPTIGTVEAALQNGREMAQVIIAHG